MLFRSTFPFIYAKNCVVVFTSYYVLLTSVLWQISPVTLEPLPLKSSPVTTVPISLRCIHTVPSKAKIVAVLN
jgi:hypothetical protein